MRLLAIFLTLLVTACAGQPDVATRDIQIDSNYTGPAISEMLVITLLKDSNFDSRVIIERGFTQQLKAAGIDATAGYAQFDNIDRLLNDTDAFENQLKAKGIKAVLFIDPVRLDTDFDPAAYDARRSAYRALGMDTSASINLWSKIAADASAAKVVMTAGLWRPGDDKDLWQATYDINAPGNYDPDTARVYAAEFARLVIEDLKKADLI